VTDSEEYREGKVKENPFRGVKKYMKPLSDKLWEGLHFYAIGDPDRVPVEE
jgi:hypothetical protein